MNSRRLLLDVFQEKSSKRDIVLFWLLTLCYWIRDWPPNAYTSFSLGRRKIRLIEGNAKCRHLKKLTCKGTLRQVFICLRPPPLLGFCLGWSSNFAGSETGQIQTVKVLQNMVSNRTTCLPPLHTVYVHTISYSHREGGGGVVEPERRGEGRQGRVRSQIWVENTNLTECTKEIGNSSL